MNTVQFGIWFCIMLTIGLITPPIGMVLFVTSNVTNIPLSRLTRPLLPFVIAAFLVTLLIAFVPEITLTIPKMMGILA